MINFKSKHFYIYIILGVIIVILGLIVLNGNKYFIITDNRPNIYDIKKNVNNDNIYKKRIEEVLEPPERTYPGIPINIKTRGDVKNYQQIGILINHIDSKDILPLFGKPTYPGSRLWNYYTRTNSYNPVKLAIINNKKKDCLNEYGCELIGNGDTITTDSRTSEYKVKLYNFDQPKYIPYL